MENDVTPNKHFYELMGANTCQDYYEQIYPPNLVRIISGMSDIEVIRSLNDLLEQKLDKGFREQWKIKTSENVNNKDLAMLLNLDYNQMSQDSVRKIKLYTYCHLIMKI